MVIGASQNFRLWGRRALAEWGVVAILSLLLVGFLTLARMTERPDHVFYDILVQLNQTPASEDILIVAIDNRSLNELGQWPWPRQHHARLLDQLAAANPKAIGYDVLFLEASADDAVLAEAIDRAGKVYLPALIDAPGRNGAPWQIDRPVSPIGEAAAGLGHVNLTIDSDGLVRRLPLHMMTGQTVWPHMTLLMAQHGGRRITHSHAQASPPSDSLSMTEDEAITFHGGPGSYRTLSFVDVMRGEVPASFLKDKLVLVGATAAGMGDRYATPMAPRGELMRGVEIQAALLQTIIDDCAIHDLPPWAQLVMSIWPVGLLLAGFLLWRPQTNMVLGLCLMALVLVISAALFSVFHLWFAPSSALAGLILAYPLWSWRRLAVASAFMQSELQRFEQAAPTKPPLSLPLLGGEGDARQGDVVTRQVQALRTTLQSLRAFERFTLEGLRSLPDATLITDNDGVIVMANQKALRLFGSRVTPGCNLDGLFASLGQLDWRHILTDPEAGFEDILAPDGRHFQPAASCLTNAEGQASGYILRLADMTQIRAAERQRDNVVQLLTHDLRAPQASILTLLQNDPDRRDPDTNRRIMAYARQTLELAESYVQLARAESQTVRRELMDLIQVAIDAADTLWPQALARGVSIRTPDADHEVLFVGDTGLIRRLLVNLFDNALKYGPPNSEITCDIAVEHSGACERIRIIVRDRGTGLSPEAVARLFQPFGQSGTETLGAGLGLAFVRTVAERHEGSVVYQDMNPGAGFIVTLPSTPQAANPE